LKPFRKHLVQPLIAGALLILPIYLAILLLLKAMKSLGSLVRPLTKLVPGWFPGEGVVSFLAVLLLCLLVGLAVRSPSGRAARNRIENSVLQKIPGYSVLRSMTQQLAGASGERAWRPSLVEIEEALVPAFIVEELDDGSFTVFVPSVPTPFAGAIYILDGARVHPVDIAFTQAIKVVTRWGSGAKEMVAAMHDRRTLPAGFK
jgi:uncharacterized membrane protein